MDAGRPRHLGDARNRHFHVRRRHQHQVRQLVNDHHNVTQLLRDDDVLLAGHDDFLVHLNREPVGARLHLFLAGLERQLRLARGQGLVFRARIERPDVAHAHARENLVAFLHLTHHPAQGEDDFFGIGDHGHHQVRQHVVLLEFHHLGINHHKPQLVRGEPVEQRSDDGIDADGFPEPCCRRSTGGASRPDRR